ncbi:UBX domain-containing protein [Fusarium sp. LHS14.1]|nr:UBX domain-containing protein [Fusarium sp. LHS14.1]
MFYQGSLQDGISTAVGQQKLVLCFVTDESEEGVQWETEFLTDDTLSELIKDHAIALRLTAGSEEAGYLAQIFPLPRTPTVVIIKNGDLKEYITPGTSKEDFIRRVQSVFNSTTSSSSAATQPAPAPPSAPAQPEPPAAAPPAAAPQTSTSENVRRILADRAARLQEQREADKKAKEERAKAEREKAKAAAMDKDNAAAHKAADAVRKRKQQDQEERARILKRIEDDKAERRMRAEERQKLRTETVETPLEAATKLPSMTKVGSMTALQVRLFDGSTLRSRFKSETALKEVREWVDESRTDGKQPYTFKQVLTPLPNKNIDETEEDKAIGDLGLSPSSTLVLIPVKKYVSAYNDSGNIFTRFIYFILGIFTWFFGLFGSREDRGASQAPAHDDDAPTSPRDESRIRAFQNQQRDQQLYNGNSLNFEPRPDEEEKDA